ncbi:pectin lyase-like protein, partial [Testicularia cyperi]
GFAAGVTGGGTASPQTPANVQELEQLLTDATPRVIQLDKVYDFRGTAGTCSDCKGCQPDSYKQCPSQSQLAIDNGQGWCSGKPGISVTYDKAGLSAIMVGSHKTIVGTNGQAAILGRGLHVKNAQNVIIRNLRIAEINPKFIWGGDAISLEGSDMVWVDHVTFHNIGRQMIVLGYAPCGRVSITNCHFDCATQWSATCDGSHYWTVLGYGKADKVTFAGNYMNKCSGRSPRLATPDGGSSTWHVVNNLFETNSGHAFDVGSGVSTLIEGNVFKDVAQTSLKESKPGASFAPADASVCQQCEGTLGRACQPNAYMAANAIPSTTSAM